MSGAEHSAADADGAHSPRCHEVLLEVGKKIEGVLRGIAPERREPTLLDVGCWDGEFSQRCGAALGAGADARRRGLPRPGSSGGRAGLEVARIDLETERLPWPEEPSADVAPSATRSWST